MLVYRFNAHSEKELDDGYLIKHKKSNKSLTYLIESDLINRAFADKTFIILNKNRQSNAIHNTHDFYGKVEVKDDLPKIWNELIKLGIFKKSYESIENDELYKYSPFKEFNKNQNEVIDKVVEYALGNKNIFIEGGAGTGKTLVIIRSSLDIVLKNENIKVGIYSAKKGNCRTFRRIYGNLPKYLTSRIKVIDNIKKNNLDGINYLLIDEAQRLRKKTSDYSAPEYFKNDEASDEIEWLNKNNIHYSLFFDYYQHFSSKDIDLKNYVDKNQLYCLNSQFRMKSGNEYIEFVKEFLGIIPETERVFKMREYDLKLFEDLEELF